jgi:hypothetical protein
MSTIELIGGPLDGDLREMREDPPPDTMFYPFAQPVQAIFEPNHVDPDASLAYEVVRYRRDLRHAMSVPGVWRYIYSP